MALIPVTRGVLLDERDIEVSFIHAGGPGGQHVNKVATAAQLRYNPLGFRPLAPYVLDRLRTIAAGRMSADGAITITARRYRSQEQNRREALERLVALIGDASLRDKPRRPSKPTRASRARRIEHKRSRSALKSVRGKVRIDED
jgi:ribosome-associated protein